MVIGFFKNPQKSLFYFSFEFVWSELSILRAQHWTNPFVTGFENASFSLSDPSTTEMDHNNITEY